MHAVRIDEILLRRGSSGLVRVIAPPVPAHQETSLGRPFGLICINVPRTPQIDALVADVEAVIEHAYSHGTLRPGQTPESFFEETVGKVRQSIAASSSQSRIRIDPSLLTVSLACVFGPQIFITRHGQADAYLIRRENGKASKVLDVFRGIGDDPEGKLLSDLIVGNVGEDDLLLLATGSLFDISSMADIAEATEQCEPAAVAARIRSIILSSSGNAAVAGCLMRLSPVRAMFRAKENASVAGMRTREEDVARTLSPSGIPGVGAFFDRLKSKTLPNRAAGLSNRPVAKPAAPARTALPRPKGPRRPLIERFNMMPKAAKRGAVVLLALAAIFIVSLQVIAGQNDKKERATQFAASVEAVKKQINLAESTLIYDEGRARSMLEEAKSMQKSLPGRNQSETAAKSQLDADLAAADRRLRHLYDVTPATIETAQGASNFVVKAGNGWLTNAGPDLIMLDANGSPTNIATLTDAPLWAAPADDGTIYLWLKNGTLVSVNTKAKSVPNALDYGGPENPRAGALWSGRLYVVSADGTQVSRLPATLTGFGRGSAYLANPLSGKGASAIAIDGSVYLAVAGDAIRRFERGAMASFALSGASANADPKALVLGKDTFYLLGADNTIATWDKTGKLIAQYVMPSDTGKITSFAVDEAAKQIVIATEGGVISRFELAK